MAVLPDQEMWVIGQPGLLIHGRLTYNDEMPYYSGDNNLPRPMISVSFLSPNDGWLIALHGQVLHWDGLEWDVSLPYNSYALELVDIEFANTNLGWAVGCIAASGDFAAIMQWDGISWQDTSPPRDMAFQYCLTDIDVISETDAWIIAHGHQKSMLLHWDGSCWNEIPLPDEIKNKNSFSVSATNPSNVWLLGDGMLPNSSISHWNGLAWETTDLQVNYAGSGNPAILALSPNDVWVGGSALFHWNGYEWDNVDYDITNGYIVDIEVDPDGEVWALTATGVILNLTR